MKKIIIIAAVIVSSALTAFAFTKTSDKKETNTPKIERPDLALRTVDAPKSDLATAD